MWLLNATTFELKYFHSVAQAPHYAILSHTWEDEEVIFQDMRDLETARVKQGWQKMHHTCEQARKDDLEYCWVDTCCINKESSAELSEAINSMFNIYKNATVCYIHLADVTDFFTLEDGLIGAQHDPDTYNPEIHTQYSDQVADEREAQWAQSVKVHAFTSARWWTRCWTLQELLAPCESKFFNKAWNLIARLHDVIMIVSKCTNIDLEVLHHHTDPLELSVAKRISWASYREATRREDVAYSLFGLLDINLPLLYGEGDRAFVRLQEELIRTNADLSTLAWGLYNTDGSLEAAQSLHDGHSILFASSPDAFRGCGDVALSDRLSSAVPGRLTNRGLELELPVIPACALKSTREAVDADHVLADIGCYSQNMLICLVLYPYQSSGHNISYSRPYTTRGIVILVPENFFEEPDFSSLLLLRGDRTVYQPEPVRYFSFRAYVRNRKAMVGSKLQVVNAYPDSHWNLKSRSMLRLQRQEPSGYRDVSQVGGVTLATADGSEVHLIFRMTRPSVRTQDGRLQAGQADTQWASFVPDLSLAQACALVEALQYKGEYTLETALRMLGLEPTLQYDFGKSAVKATLLTGRQRSLYIDLVPCPSGDHQRNTANAGGEQSLREHMGMTFEASRSTAGLAITAEDIQRVLRELGPNTTVEVPQMVISSCSPGTSPQDSLYGIQDEILRVEATRVQPHVQPVGAELCQSPDRSQECATYALPARSEILHGVVLHDARVWLSRLLNAT
ncbi:hypothetical protein LTR95_005715 [Oleoguttula sp. CCFEE 5521]